METKVAEALHYFRGCGSDYHFTTILNELNSLYAQVETYRVEFQKPRYATPATDDALKTEVLSQAAKDGRRARLERVALIMLPECNSFSTAILSAHAFIKLIDKEEP